MEEELIKRIKEMMREKGMTQRKLAELLDADPANISAILRGRRKCGEGMLNKMVVNAGVSKKWLLTGEGPMLMQGGSGNAMVNGDRNSVSTAGSSHALDKAMDELSEQRKLVAKAFEEIAEQRKMVAKTLDELSEQRSLVANAQEQSERLIRIIDNLSRAKESGQASQPARPN